jgi:hypothetical protein
MSWNVRRAMLLGQGRTFAPADEGGGGGGEGGEGEGNADGGEGEGEGSGEGNGDAGQVKSGSILDMAKTGEKQGEGEGDYKAPDYLPEHLRGKDNDETMKKLHEAYAGARKTLSKGNNKIEGTLPEKPEDYTFEDTGKEGEPDKVFAELSSEASKPMVDMARRAAHKAGIPDKAFAGFMRDFVAGAGESGLPIGMDDGEAQEISSAAEMEKLTELVGSGTEASTIVNTNQTYIEKLVARGTLHQDDMAEFRVMVGTAESSNIFYKILTAELGEKPIPVAEGGAGAMSQTDAYALHAQASALPDGAEKTQAMEGAQRAMQKAFGQNSGGSVRSSVL